MSSVDWEDVRHFTALADTLNLARAAADLRTSQVTVMRRVKALEAALGATLFLRRRDGHRLTPAGAELLRSTHEAGQLIRDGASRVGARDKTTSGRLRLVTTELAANWILLPALPAFIATNPDVRLEIDARPTAQVLDDDLETMALRFHRTSKGAFKMRKLGEISFSLYATRALATETDTKYVPYIGWTGPFEEIGLARWLRRVGGDSPPILSLTTFDGHLKAAHLGIGVAALPDFVAAVDSELVRVPTAEPQFRLEAWLVIPEQIAAMAKTRQVARFVTTGFSRIF